MAEHVIKVEMKIAGKTEITGDNEKVSFKDGENIKRIQVDHRLDSPDYFSADLTLMSTADLVVVDALIPGKTVEIILGYKEENTVFSGEISYVEPSFGSEEQTLTISGYDLSHRLTRGTSSRTWGKGHEADQDIATVAGDIVKDSKSREGDKGDSLSAETESGSAKVEYVSQFEMNDYQFIRSLGLGLAMSLDSGSEKGGKKLAFKTVTDSKTPTATICREKPDPADAMLALSADFTLSTVRQFAKVEVRWWSAKDKAAILGFAKAPSKPFDGTTGPGMAGKAHYGSATAGRVLTIVDRPVADKTEAEAVAQGILDSLSMEYVTGTVVVEGNSKLTAGQMIELKGFGKRYSGIYLVNAAEHIYSAEASGPYIVRLQIARDACPDP